MRLKLDFKLLVFCLLLSVIVWRVVSTAFLVMNTEPHGLVSSEIETLTREAAKERAMVRYQLHQDSLFTALGSGERLTDPFKRPSGVRPPKSPPKTEPISIPVVVFVIFDNVSPMVMLRADHNFSGPLHIGDEWRGWIVRDISENSIKLIGSNNEPYELKSRGG